MTQAIAAVAKSGRPVPGEYADYAQTDIDKVRGDDAVRIFAYRALCVARGETQPLPGFDENVYAAHAGGEDRPWQELLAEYSIVRAATVALLRSLPLAGWTRYRIVNGYSATARGLAFHIAGHELHHLEIVRERYLPLLA